MKKAQASELRLINQVDNSVEIVIYGAISSQSNGSAQLMEVLKQVGTVSEIIVRLNSVGGEVSEGVAMYSLLKSHPAKVKVLIDGMAASIASVIAMAGDEINMSTNAIMMIHNPMTEVSGGNSTDLRKVASDLDKIAQSIKETYLTRKLSINEQQLTKLMDEETFFTAKEALEVGLIDNIIEEMKQDDEEKVKEVQAIMKMFNSLNEEQVDPQEQQEETKESTITIETINKKLDLIIDELKKMNQEKEQTEEKPSEKIENLTQVFLDTLKK